MADEISEQDLAFMWECPPSGISIFDNSGERSNAKSAMGPPETRSEDDQQKEQKTDEEALVEGRKRGQAGEDKRGKKRVGKGKGKLGDSSDEIHIRTEKERRKKMRDLFGRLHELLPHLSPKADKATIVDEAIYFIKMQERRLHELQQLKLERLRQSAMNSQRQPYNNSSEQLITNQPFPSSLADNVTNSDPEAPIADHNGICNNMAADITIQNPHNSMEALQADHNGLPCNFATSLTNSNLYSSMDALLAGQNGSLSNFAGAVINPNPPLPSNLASAVSNPNPPFFSGPVVFESTYSSPNVVLNVYGDGATINVCSAKKEGLLTTICFVLEKYKIEVLSAHILSEANRSVYMFHTHAKNASSLFPRAFPVEEIYKQAATEINYAITMSILNASVF